MPSKKTKSTRLGRTEFCPCGSGKKFGVCCWKKRFKYNRDGKGRIYKSFPLSSELIELLDQQMLEFEAIFGRKPRGKEPIFFDRYLHSKDDYDEQFHRIATEVNIRPEVLYATEKTDRIVTEDNWHFLTKAEQDEWDDAIDEYFEKEGEGTLGVSDDISKAFAVILTDIYATICHIGLFLEKAPRSKLSETAFLQYYFAARTLDTLRTIYRWLKERHSDDIWMLLRVVYESYLKLAFLRCGTGAPEFFFALAGVGIGTHAYSKTTKGRINYREIVETTTGAKTRNISNREMIATTENPMDVEIFEELYALLSSYSHMGLDPDFRYFNRRNGFLVHKEDNPFATLQWAAIVITLWMSEIAQIPHAKKQTCSDLNYMSGRIQTNVLALLNLSDSGKWSRLLKLVHRRLS